MSYLALRHLHITCVIMTSILFALRGGLMLAGIDWKERWPVLRWLPHLNDTLLLAAAIGLAVMSQQYPLVQPWLSAKACALLAYIGLGGIALKRRNPAAFFAALLCLGYIIAVAMTRSPSLNLL
ncbi:SirB2 family protein [Chitinilyticum piscinae]|uniref:SirB2 family protein n=1 Tax=Chitinilyticum piscinae TaxID=2866724 RepID=A0A8J7FGW6_9NEIS|nr:SirB2 family protein [Chitinilyticum piscinae]MBE9609198.1 SirB2 family protein [Chitinilyticum piscinae]